MIKKLLALVLALASLAFITLAYAQDGLTIGDPASTDGTDQGLTIGASWSCPYTISSPGVYTVGADMAAGTNCITINSNNVILNGNNHRVSPLLAPMAYQRPNVAGVYVSGRTNVTIKNFNIDGLMYGIYVRDSDNVTITTNNLTNNHYGVFFDATSNNVAVTSNNASGNDYGIVGAYSTNSTVSSNLANSNDNYGIYVHGCTGTTMTGNTANNNVEEGIRVSQPSEDHDIPNYDIYGDGTLGMTAHGVTTNLLLGGAPGMARVSAFDFINSIHGGIPPFTYGLSRDSCNSGFTYNSDPKKLYATVTCADMGMQVIYLRINDSTLTPPAQCYNIYVEVQDTQNICEA